MKCVIIPCLIILQIVFVRGQPIQSGTITPCLDHLNLAKQELSNGGNITSRTGYSPRCTANGVTWEVAQCTTLNGGSCFCVDPLTGVPREDTRSSSLIREELICDWPVAQTCEEALQRYTTFLEENPNVADAPFGYRPSCGENGRFEPLQRNAFYFFCVDTITGEKIQDSEWVPGHQRPLTPTICKAYSDMWQGYKGWLRENDLAELEGQQREIVIESSCQPEFEFVTFGCKRECIPSRNVTEIDSCEFPKPVCTCPDGLYQHNDTCITMEQCLQLHEEPFVFEVKETLWNTYLVLHCDDVLKGYWNSESAGNLNLGGNPDHQGSAGNGTEESNYDPEEEIRDVVNTYFWELHSDDVTEQSEARQRIHFNETASSEEEDENEEEDFMDVEETREEANETEEASTTSSASNIYNEIIGRLSAFFPLDKLRVLRREDPQLLQRIIKYRSLYAPTVATNATQSSLPIKKSSSS